MIKAIIIEDEKPAMERLQKFLEQIHDVEIIANSTSGKQAAELIDSLKPDLVFLDIQLSDVSGIDMLHLISHKPMIIFTTAFNQYAIKAFELNAIDYLLKPFPKERLQIAIQKARDRVETGQSAADNIRKLLTDWNPDKHFLKRIPSKIGDKIYLLDDDDVVYFGSEHKLVHAFLAESKFLINYKLEELHKRLDPAKFFRIHRSTIVNLNYVSTIEAWFGGGYKLKVKDKNKTELMISRSAGKILRLKLGW